MKDLHKLQNCLFRRTYAEWMNKSLMPQNDCYAYHFAALYSIIIELGLDDKFQSWIKRQEKES